MKSSCEVSNLSRRRTLLSGSYLPVVCLLLASLETTNSFIQPARKFLLSSRLSQLSTVSDLVSLCMVMAMPADNDTWSSAKKLSLDRFQKDDNSRTRVRKKYQRKRIPETERERRRLKQERQEQYEKVVSNAKGVCPSIWSFESLFPKPVWDEKAIDRDLYEVKRRDISVGRLKQPAALKTTKSKLKTSAIGASSMMRVWRDPKLSSFVLPYVDDKEIEIESRVAEKEMTDEEAIANVFEPSVPESITDVKVNITEGVATAKVNGNSSSKVDYELTRMVEDRLYGYRRGTGLYDTSLMGDGAVKFREGIRLSNPLSVNADRLNYHAKKELRNNRVEEAQELYEMAIKIDPRDGRAYLGMSRCAERRRDFQLAKQWLSYGIANSVSFGPGGIPDSGANPFLLQALGCLEEKSGHLAQADTLYLAAAKSRSSHAAAWVALAQLRTRKFRQSAAAGRACYQMAEQELQKAGLPPSAHVYTAWASMEYKKACDVRRARNLYRLALNADKRCSAAWLQLGVMEAALEHWREAELCFETVLKFDQGNSRVMQAYALMEAKRTDTKDSNSRKVLDLFERGLKSNPRDAGNLQAYALYVANLGDLEKARELLKRATEVDKRHAPAWQAWGVLETRHGNPEEARNLFQQGIWACAQLGGGQSGGYNCARLWQAWGVLEAQEGDYAAARRCFSRALDADRRNIAAMTAWTLMEEQIGNLIDARILFERALKLFAPGTDEKKRLWRLYELMELRVGNVEGARDVYQRSLRESFTLQDESLGSSKLDISTTVLASEVDKNESRTVNREVEAARWDQGSSSMKAEVWLNKGSIEGRVPKATMNKQRQQQR